MIDKDGPLVAEQWCRRLETVYLENRERIVGLLRAKYAMVAVEDAMQEIFAQLLHRMPKSSVAREIALSSAYLFVCVRRRLLRTIGTDQRRIQSTRNACRRGAIESSESTDQKSDPVHCGEPDFDEQQLAAALEKLSPKQQEVLRLLCAANIQRHDGAKSLGCEENCFGVRRHRALLALRALLLRDEHRVGRSDHAKKTPSDRPSRRRMDATAGVI